MRLARRQIDTPDRLDPFPSALFPGDVSESESDGLAAGRLEVPSPQRSDLLTDFMPLNRTSLESAIDRFLRTTHRAMTGLAARNVYVFPLEGLPMNGAVTLVVRGAPPDQKEVLRAKIDLSKFR